MLRRLYDWTMRMAAHGHALRWLFGVSFFEGFCFPVPPDVLVVPMALARRERAFLIAGVAVLGSVAGGLAGYGIGYFLFQEIGRPLLEFYGAMDQFEQFRALYDRWGVWVVLVAGLTPVPYQVATLGSGVFEFDITVFTASAVAARSVRFFLEAALIWYVGPPVRRFIEENLALAVSAGVAVLFVVFLVVRAFL